MMQQGSPAGEQRKASLVESVRQGYQCQRGRQLGQASGAPGPSSTCGVSEDGQVPRRAINELVLSRSTEPSIAASWWWWSLKVARSAAVCRSGGEGRPRSRTRGFAILPAVRVPVV